MAKRMQVAFCHPDLGLGGAERLVVDAAKELQARGHRVVVYTGRHDPQNCFLETMDGTLEVRVAGKWVPRNVMGRMHAWCAYWKCVVVAWSIAWDAWKERNQPDVVLVDQVSVVVPLLRMWTQAKVLFYCHFPDLLLAKPKTAAHRMYRAPIDWIEEKTTGAAHRILVNSKYTASVFQCTFKSIAHMKPNVLYPAVDVPSELMSREDALAELAKTERPEVAQFCMRAKHLFLSLNRFERKKDLGLALEALEELHRTGGFPEEDLPSLVMAGGFDSRILADVQYDKELMAIRENAESGAHAIFLHNVSDTSKHALLSCCTAVLYTPQFEHFGIVPLEAMARAKPVIACNSGGPMESVLHQKTGFLVEPCPSAFAQAMHALSSDPSRATHMGRLAREHVHQRFSRAAFGDRINQEVVDLAKGIEQ